ncbi:serine/threonine-protein kinase [Azospirillum halopraeferens]|uniref:serine/threonine-protein kinase n=1 Tax=Azospirillum halopraeferens TaxID=34010 RepID=UPI0009FF7E51|nr:serine/threonine-protein kinase [Azospirillum halopraeferens]
MLKPYNKAELTFDIISEIGSDGRNSRTFISRDHQLDAEIVTKQLLKASLRSPDNFFDESKALYASAHPNVVQIHYACQDADHIYLAMPYYRRGSVKGLITGRHMTVREIVTAGCQVLSGLHNIHSKGLVHFDVKPDNILLSDRGEALISDFGKSKQIDLNGVAYQQRHYTPMIPPEATRQNEFDRTFDIYQFGLTLYRMCNGNAVFRAQFSRYVVGDVMDRVLFQQDLLAGKFPDRKCFAPHIPNKLRSIVKKCLEVDPAERYQSALDVANALADVDGSTLDWRLTESPDTRVWEKNENGTSMALTVKRNGESICYKTGASGKRTRVMAACKATFPEKEIQKFLGAN